MLSTATVSGVWLARRSTGGDAALWAGLGLGVLALAAFALGTVLGPSLGMVLWAVAGVALAVLGTGVALWGLAYRQLTYTLAESSLDITWLGRTTHVPYAAVDGVYTGQRLVGQAVPQVPVWPGIYVGPGRARGIGRLRFFATSPDPSALTLVALQHSGVVVSARNPHEFRLALIDRVQATPEAADPAATRPRLSMLERAPWSAVFDRWLPACVGVAALLLLVTLVTLVVGFDALPAQIALRFDASGQATQIAPKGDILRLPVIGFFGLLLNTALGGWLHARERLLARLLWLSAAVLQGLVLVAVVRLLQ